jgi:hypothetical protein
MEGVQIEMSRDRMEQILTIQLGAVQMERNLAVAAQTAPFLSVTRKQIGGRTHQLR